MTRYAELHEQITTNPEDDAARLALAEHIRDSEPDRAKFIEHQIAEAQKRRQQRGWVNANSHPLLQRHREEWTHTLAKFSSHIIFDRGFITSIRIDPYLYLEYGEFLCVNAPIRVVEFAKPEEGPFPTQELADSPLLARLDAIAIEDGSLSQSDLECLAASPHLDRLLHFSSVELAIRPDVYEKIATFPLIRKALRVLFSDHGFPGQRFEESDVQDMQGRWIHAWTDLAPAGKALEQRHGYIPWLHPQENRTVPFDSAWYVAQGILPVKPVGSPVTRETSMNSGPWSLLRLWHVEALESVIDRPNAVSFTRTSYLTAPMRWRQLPQPELVGRLEQLLIAAYKRRNATTAQSGDPTRMVPLVFDFEWVERGDSPAASTAASDPWVLPGANAHPDLIERAVAEIEACRRVARPGIDARAYADAFHVFRIDADDSWHIIGHVDRGALFAARFE